MMLDRAFYAEALKMKRTIALKMVVLAPIAVVSLTGFIASQAPVSTLHAQTSANIWLELAHINLQFWGLLMMPLYITLETALVAGLDHSGNQWKALFARPVPRWTVYVAKLAVIVAMVAASGAVLFAGILGAGVVLPWVTPGLHFPSIVPFGGIVRPIAEMTGLAFLSLVIQHCVSLRWRSFSVATGVGIVAMVTAIAMVLAAGQYGAWPQYFPWALPALVIARPEKVVAGLWIGALAGIIVSAAGCIDFCRRELT